MQSVGAAWLMTSLTTSALYVALIQTASALPFFVLALPAGSIGDIVDRRKLILGTELWMLAVGSVLAVATIAGAMTPWLLLLLTFALSAGDALESPAWRAIFPELVPREDLPPALALNGIEFNLARAVGPGLAGLIIAVAGIGVAFVLNAVSFLGVIVVIARWKRPVRKSRLPAETVGGATVAAIRYVRYSPGIRILLFRSACVIFFSSAFWALLPPIAKRLSNSSWGYGLLLGSFGVGAVVGAIVLQRTRKLLSVEAVVSAATAAFALVILAVAMLQNLWLLSVPIFFGGAAWTVFMSVFNTLAQTLALTGCEHGCWLCICSCFRAALRSGAPSGALLPSTQARARHCCFPASVSERACCCRYFRGCPIPAPRWTYGITGEDLQCS